MHFLFAVASLLVQRGWLIGGTAAFQRAKQRFDRGRDNQAAENAAQQRIRPQPIGAVILIVAFADGIQAGNVRLLIAQRADFQSAGGGAFVIDPQTAHRVMDGGENFHRHFARIDALELFVNAQNAAELFIEHVARNVRQVEIHGQSILLDAQSFVGADVENLARGNIARHQIAVFRISLFEEVVSLRLRECVRGSRGSCGLRGTHTRPPSPRALSLIRRNLSAPGTAVGCT